MREADTGSAGPAGPVPKRPILWRIPRILLAVAVPPLLPYLTILLMPLSTLGRINAALGWDMQTAMFGFVMPAMAIMILGWIVGALRAWQSRNGGRSRPVRTTRGSTSSTVEGTTSIIR